MSKKQKIWLGIFSAMFLVPEILWGLCGNFFYNMMRFMFELGEEKVFYALFDFPDSSQSSTLLVIFLLIQVLGLSGIFGFVFRMNLKKIIKYSLLAILAIIIISNLFFLLFIVNFNPRIG